MGSIGEKHMTRLAMPKSWQIKRKGIKYVKRPNPGSHPIALGIPLTIALRDLLGLAKTSREVRTMLHTEEVLVDGKRRRDGKFIVGIMDVISIPKIKAHYRVLINNKGKIVIININEKEAAFKLCKIRNKSPLGKKIQINCTDGRNILIEKGDYKTSDSLVVEMPSQKIKENLPFAKGNTILLLGGKHMGDIGLLEEIKGNKIICKKGKEYVETLKKYAFVIGKDKSIITLP